MESNSQSLPHGYVLQGEKNRYVIDRVLGQGSFGITYLAKYKTTISGSMGTGSGWLQVAIKEFFMRDMNTRDGSTGYLNDASQDSIIGKYRRAFVREARNLASLTHPGIVNVFEVIETNNTVYIVMEYIDGGSLDDYISSRGRLTENESLGLFREICVAVDFMHRHRMLHLDIKPRNIMIDEEGHTRLIDFGLSKQYTEGGEPESSTSIGLGTPGYAPIEQAERTDNDTSFRPTIDIYALGATLYKMLTGSTPPPASKVSESALEGEDLISSTLKEQGISDTTASLVTKAMWPSGKKRYQSTAEFIAAIDSVLQEQESKEEKGNDEEEEWTVVEITSATPASTSKPASKPIEALKSKQEPNSQPESAKESKKGLLSWLYGAIVAIVVGLMVLLVTNRNNDDPEIKGKTPAQIRILGCNYMEGTGGKTKDYTKAMKYALIAAEHGNDDAMVDIGYMYRNGYGVAEDYAEALKWYRKSADQGNAYAQNNLGNMYYSGYGVLKDYAEALKWYRKAADQGHADAQFRLGFMYDNGYGVEKDYAEAVKWYRKSADQGNSSAQSNLGFMYHNGYGVAKDDAEAVKWYRKSADQGNAYGQNLLGVMYWHGDGVEKDYSEAVKWYRKAAEQGLKSAQYNLGLCYKNGWGVDENLTEAKKWFEKAAAQDHEGAKNELSKLQ